MMKTCCCCQKHLISNPQKEDARRRACGRAPLRRAGCKRSVRLGRSLAVLSYNKFTERDSTRCEVRPSRCPTQFAWSLPLCAKTLDAVWRPQHRAPADVLATLQACNAEAKQEARLISQDASSSSTQDLHGPLARRPHLPRVLEEGAAPRDTRPVLVPNPNAAGTCNAAGQARRPATA